MKIIKRLFLSLCAVFLLWVAISYANIVAHNNTENPTYHDWNFFVVAFKD